MYGIQVERMEGRSSMGHYFPHSIKLMKSGNEPWSSESKQTAEWTAQHYRDVSDPFTICKKIYTVVEL
jgi:hypothetical protein